MNEPELPDKLYFRIGEVAELVGVEPHVLRYWENEFRLRPHRSQSGQRLYRKQDVAKLFHVKRLLHDEGYTVAGARKALNDPLPEEPTSTGTDPELLLELRRRLSALRSDIAALVAELD